MYNPDTIAANIRAERARARMTQGDLGNVTGIAQSRISAFENGALMDFEQATAIADALNISLDYLAGRDVADSD